MKAICQRLFESHLWEVNKNSHIHQLRDEIKAIVAELSELISGSEDRFHKLDFLHAELEYLLSCDYFESGYQMGMRVVSEALTKEDLPELLRND